jgi:hypothetical protein
MFKADIISVTIVSLYLLTYAILIQNPDTEIYAVAMWTLSPFLIVWMVYMVIRHGKYLGKEFEY